MPKRYRKKKRYYGKAAKYRRVARRSRAPNPFRQVLFGPKLKVKLIWTDFGTLDPGASQTTASVVYQANSLFDPAFTGGAVQPRGFDQIMDLFDQYTVVGARITCVFTPAAATTEPSIVGIQLLDNSTATTNLRTAMESRISKWKPLDVEGKQTVVMNFSARHFFARGNPLNDSTQRGLLTTSPTEGAFFHVWGTSAGIAINGGPINLVTRIEFLCVFTEPFLPSAS